ncbi:MAG: AMP-binding protein, partial [Mycolicibacterium sp.]|nr:AMP-binding protein [Mycolicibacterium sp.]
HHHLLMDGWSSFLILKDVLAFYGALSEGRDCRLEPVRPYRDYIHWLQRQDRLQAEEFWRRKLKGFAAPTPLLGSQAAGGYEHQDYEAAQEVSAVPPSLTAALQSFARRHNLTLSTIVQGAWAILLSRTSGEEDVVFGSVVSGRPPDLMGAESMVGLFINTLPVRARLSPDQTVLPWLKSFQDELAELRQYEHSPLTEVQRLSDAPRDQPLFESLLSFDNYPVDASARGRVDAVQVSNMRVIGPINYPLSLVVVPREELSIRVSYDPRRFDAATIGRMLGHFQTLLEEVVTDPDRRLAELPLLTEAERRQVLVEWNRTEAAFPKDRCLHELFEEQVERTPDAIAAAFEGRRLTYRGLNARANQLARHLQGLGVGPDTLVAICVERSLQMLVGLLGILKAGGAYVPLDPAYPSERLAFMLEDSQARVLLTQQSLRSALPAGAAHVVCLDAQSSAIKKHETSNLQRAVRPNNLAYAIYTSGSTGRPKGVCAEHRGTINRLQWMWRRYPFAAGERCAQKTALSFVDSV